MKLLIFGATGMLGHVLRQELTQRGHQVLVTCRAPHGRSHNLEAGEFLFDAEKLDKDHLQRLLDTVRPDVAINAVGIIKQLKEAKQKALSIRVNALWPHVLGEQAAERDIRVIHFGTDCVFSGRKGDYVESDLSDISDVYGMTKYLGDIEESTSLTLRTSIIGHELASAHSLVDWFLSQKNQCKGYTQAIYTGFPTVVIADILHKVVFPNKLLQGIYHLSSQKINKYELLQKIAKEYGKNIEIIPDDAVRIDRSLDSSRFTKTTGYKAPSWEEMIQTMHKHYVSSGLYQRKAKAI